jgi:hypothetical protein
MGNLVCGKGVCDGGDEELLRGGIVMNYWDRGGRGEV